MNSDHRKPLAGTALDYFDAEQAVMMALSNSQFN